jgi:hypothetical protein
MDPNIIVLIGLGVYLGGFYIVTKYCHKKKPTKLRYIKYRPLSEAV